MGPVKGRFSLIDGGERWTALTIRIGFRWIWFGDVSDDDEVVDVDGTWDIKSFHDRLETIKHWHIDVSFVIKEMISWWMSINLYLELKQMPFFPSQCHNASVWWDLIYLQTVKMSIRDFEHILLVLFLRSMKRKEKREKEKVESRFSYRMTGWDACGVTCNKPWLPTLFGLIKTGDDDGYKV